MGGFCGIKEITESSGMTYEQRALELRRKYGMNQAKLLVWNCYRNTMEDDQLGYTADNGDADDLLALAHALDSLPVLPWWKFWGKA